VAGGPPAAGENRYDWRHRFGFGAGGVLTAFAGWELSVRGGVVDQIYLPPPSRILAVLPELVSDGPLAADVGTSLWTVAVGLAIGFVLGVTLAVATYLAPWLRWAVSPLVELVRGIAPLALLPAFLLLFGLGTPSAIAIIVWVAWVPIFLNVLEGLDSTDRELVLVARSMGANLADLLVSVYAPSLVGYLLTGLRLGLGNAWLAVVAAEMLGANAGIGFRILEWSQTFRIVDMYGAIVVIGLIGLALNSLILLVQRRYTRWRSV
jgi:NitT/TauT family transport system permease protein